MSMVDSLIAGDTLDFTDVVADYPATAAWVLKYRLVPRFTTPVQAPVEITATTVNTTDYRVQATPTATAAWTPGTYNWFRWVEKAGERQSLGSGSLTVQVNPATVAQGADIRSQAERAIDDLRTAYAAFDGTRSEFSIAGRSIKFATRAEIVRQLSYWSVQLKRERRASAMAAGLPDPSILYVRSGRA
jgi:uncharacterized protein involved in type VI secretion and phage assembly